MHAGRDAQKGINIPHRFFYRKFQPNKVAIVLPMTSSERREYFPVGLISENIIPSNGVLVIYDYEPYIFSILSSKMHMLWAKSVAGKLESRIRYSNTLTYNTFPIPKLTTVDIDNLNIAAFNILEAREKFSDQVLAELYDPDTMPIELKEAHLKNDVLIENLYAKQEFQNDDQRIEAMFNLYSKMVKK